MSTQTNSPLYSQKRAIFKLKNLQLNLLQLALPNPSSPTATLPANNKKPRCRKRGR